MRSCHDPQPRAGCRLQAFGNEQQAWRSRGKRRVPGVAVKPAKLESRKTQRADEFATGHDEVAIQERNLTRILHRTVPIPKEEHTSVRRDTLKASSLALRDYQYELPAVEFERTTQVKHLNCKITNEYKKLARDSLRDHVTSMVPLITSQLGGVPDILHLFVKKIWEWWMQL